tara:strand:- start:178 stop:651 length:474 start_codon:yes stop_codon:yes gene_type:complete
MLNYLQLSTDQIRDLLTTKVPSLVISSSNITVTPFTYSTPNTNTPQTLPFGNIVGGVGASNSDVFYLGDLSVISKTTAYSLAQLFFWFNTGSFLNFTKINENTTFGDSVHSSFHKGILFTGITSIGSNVGYNGGVLNNDLWEVPQFTFSGIKIQINN